LEVSKIEAGCSCVSVPQLPEPIAPGDSAAIPVTFKTGRYQGRVRKTTKVYAGDGEEAFQLLTIVADVVKQDEATGHIRISPPILKWTLNDRVIGADSDTLTITNDGPGAYRVSLLDIPSGVVRQAEVRPGNTLYKQAQLFLAPSKERVPPDVRSPSITLSFEGQDTLAVTVPIVLGD
jgi:hypothetical protein